MNRKGISPLLAGVMYVAIVVVSIVIIINVVTPYIQKMKDEAAFEQAKNIMTALDKAIREVAYEGKGSTRVLPLQIKKGKLIIDNETDSIKYELETKTLLVSPNTKRKIGNLVFTANNDVDVDDFGTYIRMRNRYLEINFTKVGNASYYQPINLSELITGVKLLEENVNFVGKVITKVDYTTENGTGYVRAEETGHDLPYGRVIVHLNTSEAEFDIYYTLNSFADYLIIEGENYVAH